MIRILLFSIFYLIFFLPGKCQTFIADSNFRNILLQTNPNLFNKSKLLIDSAAALFPAGINCSGKNIVSLSGIEKFTSLSSLDCSANQIYSLDGIKNLSKLSYLDCHDNNLTQLPDLTKLTKLVFLNSSVNKITLMPDLSNNSLINQLGCFNNQITRIPGLDKLINLTNLFIYNNQIDSLPDLSRLTKLNVFQCYTNKIRTVKGLSEMTNLVSFIAGDNPWKQIPDLSKLTKMQILMLWSSKLDQCPSLVTMPNLSLLDLNNNFLTALPDLSNNKALLDLRFQDNLIDSIPGLSYLSSLQKLNMGGNKLTNIRIISFSQNTLTDLIANNNRITDLPELSNFRALKVLHVENNQLTFEDLLPASNRTTVTDFTYSPQKNIVIPEIRSLKENDVFKIVLNIDRLMTNNSYEWFKNAEHLSWTKIDSLVLRHVSKSDSGRYVCFVSNPLLPDLLLQTTVLHLEVLPCIQLTTKSFSTLDITCESAGKINLKEDQIIGGIKPFHYTLISKENGEFIRSDSPLFKGLKVREYLLSVSDQNGCSDTIAVALKGTDPEDCKNFVIVYNAGDAASFYLKDPGTANVFDLTGKLIYTFKTPASWDGTISGTEVNPGLYFVEYNGKASILPLLNNKTSGNFLIWLLLNIVSL